MSERKKTLQELARIRDELRLKAHLASEDAKDQWEELEGRWSELLAHAKARAEPKVDALDEAAGDVGGAAELVFESHSTEELGDAARLLAAELKRGYQRMRDA